MNITELSREQLIRLKQAYLFERAIRNNESISYDDLMAADDDIPDDVIISEYGWVDFKAEDFWQ